MPLNKYFPKRTYGLFLRKGKVLSPAAREFIRCIDPGALDQFSAENTLINNANIALHNDKLNQTNG